LKLSFGLKLISWFDYWIFNPKQKPLDFSKS